MADLLLQIIGSDGASAPLRAVASGFQELGKLALECTKAFEEQAKADRQLERYAGDLTGAFKAQATAFQEQLGVSDDMVQSIQTMLLRFGEAPDQVEATTRAILDYSAATGEDAVSATKTLLGSVNSGKQAFKDLGLEYEMTGHKSADLVAVTGALAAKLGGSAQAEADSVSGQARIAKQAIGEFQESIGGLVSEFITKTGAVSTFTEAIRTLQEILFKAPEDSIVGLQKNLDSARRSLEEMTGAWAGAQTILSAGAFGPSGDDIDKQTAEVARLEKALASLIETKRTAARQADELTDLRKDPLTNKGKKEAEKEANERKLSDFETFGEAMTQAEFRRADDQEKALAKLTEDREAARVKDAAADAQELADEDKHFEARRQQISNVLEYERGVHSDQEKELQRYMKSMEEKTRRQAEQFRSAMEQMGASIGIAFAQALGEALTSSLTGNEVDGTEIAIDLGATVVQIVGTAISAAGYPAIGALVSGVGGVAVGVGKSVYQSDKAKRKAAGPAATKKHDGGWIGEYHSGGWPGASSDEEMAMLQHGERVVSRPEVARAGGKGALDRMLRGGGGGSGVTLNVSTMDAGSFTDFLGDRGGRGFFNAVRTGRGMLSPLLGGR